MYKAVEQEIVREGRLNIIDCKAGRDGLRRIIIVSTPKYSYFTEAIRGPQ